MINATEIDYYKDPYWIEDTMNYYPAWVIVVPFRHQSRYCRAVRRVEYNPISHQDWYLMAIDELKSDLLKLNADDIREIVIEEIDTRQKPC